MLNSNDILNNIKFNFPDSMGGVSTPIIPPWARHYTLHGTTNEHIK